MTAPVPLKEIFLAFLAVGATSFGGSTVPYLRVCLVLRRKWLDEESFLSALEIAQALPGSNATNMSVIVGDRLRGLPGAASAFLGMSLPGALAIFFLGAFYASNAGSEAVHAILHGIGAASVGLLLAVTLQIGRTQLARATDLILVLLTFCLIDFLRVPLFYVLLFAGLPAICLCRFWPAEPWKKSKS